MVPGLGGDGRREEEGAAGAAATHFISLQVSERL